ncbi:hypothetical protein Tsubulata_027988 [Turnera subulata]|uniref:Negative regulator of systemic acquired resistance SNI1 n=1 Tax=Turnera subulata TaxID=218843 RepID=A0A9Q0FHX9_9ROSI|nr:hypothetical protein Tsubulata_027988 [Turnera subulata]
MEIAIANRRRLNAGGVVEENILAILDVADTSHTQHATDDRISFLEAVRAACIVNRTPPTNKMCEAVFRIMRISKSLELVMESYRLLNELDEHFPRVYVSEAGESGSSKLVVDEEAWSPFVFNLDIATIERETSDKSCTRPLDPLGFQLLLQELLQSVNDTNLHGLEIKSLRNMLLFQYLVNALGGDFVPRNNVYEETMDWVLLRESSLGMLMSSRRINYKNLMKDCLSIMCGLHEVYSGSRMDEEYSDNSEDKPSPSDNCATAVAFPEVASWARTAMQKLLIFIMELDASRKIADMQGRTTRADGVRTPLLEIIVDELSYNTDLLSSFLQILDEPKWKLEIILQYFSKYTGRVSTNTRRSSGSKEDMSLSGVLKGFTTITSTKNIIKKINAVSVQVLLAHAFQAYLSLSSSLQDAESNCSSKKEANGSSLIEICKNTISAFSNLKRVDGKMAILPIAKEALFTAATISSTESEDV